jgi:hypothetical protein
MNPRAPQIRTTHAHVPWDFVDSLSHALASGSPATSPPEEIAACSILGRQADRQAFRDALASVKDHLLRLKGIVDFGEGPVLVESVFGSFTERAVTTARPRYGITVIGWKTTSESLTQAFAPALQTQVTPLANIEL